MSKGFEDIKALWAGFTDLEAAIDEFRQESTALRQQLSDTALQELMRIKALDPSISMDDVIAEHNRIMAIYDTSAGKFEQQAGKIKPLHRREIDHALDAVNELRRKGE